MGYGIGLDTKWRILCVFIYEIINLHCGKTTFIPSFSTVSHLI